MGASEKLDQITEDQADAIRKRDASAEIKAQIEKEEVGASEKLEKIERALGEAKPALESAQAAVKGIKKKQLDQIRSYANPPKLVKLSLEPVMLMLDESASDWKAIKKVVARKDFKDCILNFDVENLGPKRSIKLKKKYFDQADYTYEKINKASKACGPLQKWVVSMIKFAAVKNSVAPLEAEMKALNTKLTNFKDELVKLDEIRTELEA